MCNILIQVYYCICVCKCISTYFPHTIQMQYYRCFVSGRDSCECYVTHCFYVLKINFFTSCCSSKRV